MQATSRLLLCYTGLPVMQATSRLLLCYTGLPVMQATSRLLLCYTGLPVQQTTSRLLLCYTGLPVMQATSRLLLCYTGLPCLFLIWCFAPTQWNGSSTLYYRFIRPFILRHQGNIDQALHQAKDAFNEVSGLAKESLTKVQDSAEKIVREEVKQRAVHAAKDE
ncbi:hypothetical protein ACOMHN_058414 [Nucella lapillus]